MAHDRRLIVLLSLVVISILVSTASLGVTIHNLANSTAKAKNELVPILCNSGYVLENGETEENVKQSLECLCAKGEKENCGMDREDALNLLMNTMFKRKTPGIAPEPLPVFEHNNFQFSPASAHIRLLPSRPYISTSGLVPGFGEKNIVLHMNSELEVSNSLEHAHNVNVTTAALRILHSGMYYVYSSIRFNPDSVKPCKNFSEQTWPHTILRNSPTDGSSSETILRSVHTCCDDCLRDKETSYTGGVFHLKAGDQLQVEVSGYALVRFDKHASFMGVFMLGAHDSG